MDSNVEDWIAADFVLFAICFTYELNINLPNLALKLLQFSFFETEVDGYSLMAI
jgi:hypothetical protein